MSATLIESSYTSTRKTATITTRDDAISLKNVPDGTEIQLEGYVIQEITNENTGEIFQSIMIAAADGNVYATRSETFIRKIKEIMQLIAEDPEDDEPIIIRLSHGQSRSGNKFATCSLA